MQQLQQLQVVHRVKSFENPGQKAEINFSTAVTRATALDTEGLQNAGFQVYAYNTGTTEMSTTAVLPSSAWIANKATYASTWSVAGGPYYWPLDENLQFLLILRQMELHILVLMVLLRDILNLLIK